MKNRLRLLTAGLLFALLLPMAASCGTPNENGSDKTSDNASDNASDKTSGDASEPHDPILMVLNENRGAPTEPATPNEAFERALCDLSLTLLRKMAQEKPQDNRLVSALSIATALAMTAGGANGETLAQMEAVLGGTPIEEYAAMLAGLYIALPSEEDASFKHANALFVTADPGFALKDSFLAFTDRYFSADVGKLDFSSSSAVDAVNEWCDRHTDGMIPKLVAPGDFSANTRLLLLNALCFDALWEEPYQKYACAEESFHGVNGDKTVTMLHGSEHTYLEGEKEIGFLKSYRGGRYAFAALLPKEPGALTDYLETLTGERFLALMQGRQSCTVQTAIPKFSTDDSVQLNEILQSLGMTAAFDFSADFTGMTERDDLYIGQVLHKTHLELDESGTRAAAVTMVEMLAKGIFIDPEQIKTVVLDRPFVYAIVDTATGLPVFMGMLNQ